MAPPESDPPLTASTNAPAPPRARKLNAEGFAVIRRFAREQPLGITVACAGGVVWGVMVVASTMVLGWVTDQVIRPAFSDDPTTRRLWLAVVALAAVGVLRGLSVVVRRWFGSITEAKVQASLRQKMVDRVLILSPKARRERSPGELLAIADNDVTFSTTALMPVPLVVGLVALIITAVVSLFLSDWTFAVIGIVVFPALIATSQYFSVRMVAPARLAQERFAQVSRVAHESFDGAMLVKVLGREQAEVDRFSSNAGALRDARLRLARVSTTFQPLVDAIPYLGMVALMVAGAFRMRSGAVTQGDVVKAITLLSWLGFPVRVAGFLFESLPRAVVSLGRVDGVVNADAMQALHGDQRHLPDGALSLDVNGVGYSYDGEAQVLDGIDLHVAPNEVVAIVGPTGSGKSTLCELLVRIDEPTVGEIGVGGVAISHVDPDELRAAVSLVFQETFLFADTVRNNLVLGLGDGPNGRSVSDDELWDVLKLAAADGFVSELTAGLDTVLGERGVTLSGGQRQRLALARAVLRRPRMLILDDSTSAVDPRIESAILANLSSAQAGVTLLVVAHRLSTIALADRIAYLELGRLVAVGTHDELLDHPGYAALVSAYEVDNGI